MKNLLLKKTNSILLFVFDKSKFKVKNFMIFKITSKIFNKHKGIQDMEKIIHIILSSILIISIILKLIVCIKV